jgi:hypothetical protein
MSASNENLVSPPVCLGVGHLPGVHDQIFITCRHMRSLCCAAPSLKRGRLCNLLEQFAVILESKYSWPHLTVSLDTLPIWRARSPPYLHPPGAGWPNYTFGDGIEYLYRSAVSRKRRQKENPVPGGVTFSCCPSSLAYMTLGKTKWKISRYRFVVSYFYGPLPK